MLRAGRAVQRGSTSGHDYLVGIALGGETDGVLYAHGRLFGRYQCLACIDSSQRESRLPVYYVRLGLSAMHPHIYV